MSYNSGRRSNGSILDADSKKRIPGVDAIGRAVPLTKEDWSDVVFYRDFHRCMARHWKCHMSASEYVVLDALFDRTIGWGKLWEYVSLRHFVHGVQNDERSHTDGSSLGKRTVERSLQSLQHKRVIFRRGFKGETLRCAINLLWVPPRVVHVAVSTGARIPGAESYWRDIAAERSLAILATVYRDRQKLYKLEYGAESVP